MAIKIQSRDSLIAAYFQIKKANKTVNITAEEEDRNHIKQMTYILLNEAIADSSEFKNGEEVPFSPIDFGKIVCGGKDAWSKLTVSYKNNVVAVIRECAEDYAKYRGINLHFLTSGKGRKRFYTYSRPQITAPSSEPNTADIAAS